MVLPVFSPIIDLVGETMEYFLQETPARRVFEMQKVFAELLEKINAEKVIFVLEDIERKIKLILRQANLNYFELSNLSYQPNPLICIAIQASKYVITDSASKRTMFQEWYFSKEINSSDIFNRFIFSTSVTISPKNIFDHTGKLNQTRVIDFITRETPNDIANIPSTPNFVDKFYSHDDKEHWYLPDFYLKDL